VIDERARDENADATRDKRRAGIHRETGVMHVTRERNGSGNDDVAVATVTEKSWKKE